MQLTEPDGLVAFASGDVEAPVGWSNLPVAVLARRYRNCSAGTPKRG